MAVAQGMVSAIAFGMDAEKRGFAATLLFALAALSALLLLVLLRPWTEFVRAKVLSCHLKAHGDRHLLLDERMLLLGRK